MSMGPCDFMDEVLRLMKAHGIDWPQPEDEGDWSDEDYTSVTNALARALRLGKEARDAAAGEQFIILEGTLSDGFVPVGPFPSFDDASNYAELHIEGQVWIMTLESPAASVADEYRCPVCGELSAGGFIACCTPDELPEPGDIRETGK